MQTKEYDLFNWTSFPSSAKLVNDEGTGHASWGPAFRAISVIPGSTLIMKVNAKQENVLYTNSWLPLAGFNGKEWRPLRPTIVLPLGSFDWTPFSIETLVPGDIVAISGGGPQGGAGSKELPGITWIDDLQIFQNGVLIYADEFSNWNPLIGAVSLGVLTPVAAVVLQKEQVEKQPLIAAGLAVLGALTGAGIGFVVPPLEVPLQR